MEFCVTQGAKQRVLCQSRESRKRTVVTQGGIPKSINIVLMIPLDHRAGPSSKRDLERNSGYQPLLAFVGRLLALEDPIVDVRRVQTGFQNRHCEVRSAPWEAKKGQKALPMGVLKWNRTNDRKEIQARVEGGPTTTTT